MMSYRIQYEKRHKDVWRWWPLGLCLGMLAWCAAGLEPVWQAMAAGEEGLYEALARFVGGMILGAG